jgi:hypothetical protein
MFTAVTEWRFHLSHDVARIVNPHHHLPMQVILKDSIGITSFGTVSPHPLSTWCPIFLTSFFLDRLW